MGSLFSKTNNNESSSNNGNNNNDDSAEASSDVETSTDHDNSSTTNSKDNTDNDSKDNSDNDSKDNTDSDSKDDNQPDPNSDYGKTCFADGSKAVFPDLFVATILFETISGESQETKTKLCELLSKYKAFDKPDDIKTIDDAIEAQLSLLITNLSSVIPSTIEQLSGSLNLKVATAKNNDGSCFNDSTDVNAYFNSIIIIFRGAYLAIVSELLYAYYLDCNNDTTNGPGIFKQFITDDTKDKILKENFQPVIQDLWYRLVVSFWLAKLIDIGGNDDKIMYKLLMYVMENNDDITKSNPGIIMCNESNVKTLITFFIMLGAISSSNSNGFNATSDCSVEDYLKEIKSQSNVDPSIIQVFQASLGLLFDDNGNSTDDPSWTMKSFQPDKMRDMFSQVAKNTFNDTNGILQIPKESFVPLNLQSCGISFRMNTLVLVVLILFFIMLVILIIRYWINRKIENETIGYDLII